MAQNIAKIGKKSRFLPNFSSLNKKFEPKNQNIKNLSVIPKKDIYRGLTITDRFFISCFGYLEFFFKVEKMAKIAIFSQFQ